MSSNALTVTPQTVASMTDTRRTTQQMLAQRGAIVDAMAKVMRKDIDFGVVPGTDKPSLWKPGSEKILALFNLAANPSVEDLSTPDCIRYRVHVTVTHIPTGSVLGAGVGEASSAESKYQWRAVVCQEEWNETPEDRRRNKWKRGKGGTHYSVAQVRADMEDVANTVLKMAKKRAQIDAVLTATAASDVFAQDLEELREAGIEIGEEGAQTQERPEELQKKPPPAQQTQQRTQTQQPAQQQTAAGPVITEQQAKKWWAVALETHGDFKHLMDYLRETLHVGNKAQIPASRWDEALAWAEGKAQ